MKLYLGDTPVKALYSHTDSDDATIVASDMQSGMTAYAKGRKVTGTGKAFAFAVYGAVKTNFPLAVPSAINVIEIASTDYPVKIKSALNTMKDTDFSTAQTIGSVTIDSVEYPITAKVESNTLTVGCSKSIDLEAFYGKDDHV